MLLLVFLIFAFAYDVLAFNTPSTKIKMYSLFVRLCDNVNTEK